MKLPSNLKYFFLISLVLVYLSTKAQDSTFVIPDSLKSSSYDDLFNKFLQDTGDTIKSRIYLNTVYKKALGDDNDLRKAQSLANLYIYEKNIDSKKELLDLSLYHVKKSGNKVYSMVVYCYLGGHHLDVFEYDKALDSYLESLSLAQEINSKYYIYISTNTILHL